VLDVLLFSVLTLGAWSGVEQMSRVIYLTFCVACVVVYALICIEIERERGE
jgi:hypothetical protein